MLNAGCRVRPHADLSSIESAPNKNGSLFMHIALSLILLSSVSSSVMAQSETDQHLTEATQQVNVASSRDPDWKPYRKMLDGIDAFDRYHSLAPQAQLKFILRPQQPQLATADLKLRIVGDNVSVEIPIAADMTFSVPRDDSAAKDDADLRLSAKKGLFRWRPDIHSAGIPPGKRRLGDLRLECEVRWAVDKFDASLIKLAYLVPLGGVCHTSRSRVFYSTNAPITGATLVSGSRRERLPAEHLDAKDRARYAPPLHDQSWPDDTLVEFELAAPNNATKVDAVSLP